MIVDAVILIHGVGDHDAGADVDHGGQRVLTAVGDVLFDGGREHRGEQIRSGRRGHGVKAHDAHSAGVELRERRVLLNVFFHDAAGICAQVGERFRARLLRRRAEHAHARALTLAIGLVDDLAAVTGEAFEQRRIHVGRLHAAAAVKIGEHFGENVFVHEDRDVAAVGEVLAELRARPQRGHGALLRLRALVIADPFILVEGDMVLLFRSDDVPLDLGGILSVALGIIRGKFADIPARGDPFAQCPFLFHICILLRQIWSFLSFSRAFAANTFEKMRRG